MGRLSRRNFLSVSAVAAAVPSAAFTSGCGEEEGAQTGPKAELGALNYALGLELSAIAIYDAGAGLLSGGALATAALFAEQEREHADALTAAIEDLGGTPASPRSEEAYRKRLGLDRLRDEEEFLNLAVDLENTEIAVYGGALAKIGSPELRSMAIEIVAAEAEHLSVLLGELGEPQVPDAFVVGARPQGRQL